MKLRRGIFQAFADPTRSVNLTMVAAQSMTEVAIASNFNTAKLILCRWQQAKKTELKR